jgi:hypothetical protein
MPMSKKRPNFRQGPCRVGRMLWRYPSCPIGLKPPHLATRNRQREGAPVDNADRESRLAEGHAVAGLPSLPDVPNAGELFIRRLKRVLLLRFYTEALLSPNDRHLLDRVIFASLCDCIAAGQGAEARRLVSEARAGVGLFRRPAARRGSSA